MLETKLENIEAHAAWLLMEIKPEKQQEDIGHCLSVKENQHWHSIQHPIKKLEFLAVRHALKILFQKLNFDYKGIFKDEFGKPFPKSYPGSISLTHAYPYVAVQWRKDVFAGIDLEAINPKLQKVANRVLCPRELLQSCESLNTLTAFWCAKEALYKIYGKRELIFKEDLQITVLEQELSSILLEGKIFKNNFRQIVRLKYLNYNNFGFAYVHDASLV